MRGTFPSSCSPSPGCRMDPACWVSSHCRHSGPDISKSKWFCASHGAALVRYRRDATQIHSRSWCKIDSSHPSGPDQVTCLDDDVVVIQSFVACKNGPSLCQPTRCDIVGNVFTYSALICKPTGACFRRIRFGSKSMTKVISKEEVAPHA